ncbi:MAG TPA: hypothetical protein VK324_01700 [Tepidisphaeraceae bacterium]|nr:hypothetical protein [Tepidisphaeraceae bacterium]
MRFHFWAVVLTCCLLVGCDREGSTSTSAATPAPAPVSDPYATYKSNVQPLVDELLRVESLIVNPSTMDFPELDKRVKEMNFAHAKVLTVITARDKERQSYKSMLAVMEHTSKAHALLKSVQNAPPEPSPPPFAQPQTSAEVLRNQEHVLRQQELLKANLGLVVQALRVQAELPKVLTQAVVEIQSMKQAFTEKH